MFIHLKQYSKHRLLETQSDLSQCSAEMAWKGAATQYHPKQPYWSSVQGLT